MLTLPAFCLEHAKFSVLDFKAVWRRFEFLDDLKILRQKPEAIFIHEILQHLGAKQECLTRT